MSDIPNINPHDPHSPLYFHQDREIEHTIEQLLISEGVAFKGPSSKGLLQTLEVFSRLEQARILSFAQKKSIVELLQKAHYNLQGSSSFSTVAQEVEEGLLHLQEEFPKAKVLAAITAIDNSLPYEQGEALEGLLPSFFAILQRPLQSIEVTKMHQDLLDLQKALRDHQIDPEEALRRLHGFIQEYQRKIL